MAPLTCRELIEFLDDYVDGTLACDRRCIFESHLKDCPPCKSYMASYRDTIRLSKKAMCDDSDASALPKVPEELIQAILKARKSQ